MKILIAEDDRTSRLMLEAVLKSWGHDVTSAEDGSEAWRLLQEPDAPRLAVLDWMMPGMDGAEICGRLRKKREKDDSLSTYIILLTIRTSKEDIVEGLDAGANDYITKPFDINELRARVDVGRRVVELEDALAERVSELRNALEHIETLQGVLPICMYCHKIKNDAESWDRLEKYISEHSDAEFSHSICPDCAEEHFPRLREGKRA
jgi:DNA-binding response OmpR family regulator